MKALLLAGGFGTRLRPLTYSRPKHLLPIANRPHIDLVLELLSAHGVDEVILTTSYLAEAFEPTVAAARAAGIKVEVTHEAEALGTAGAMKHAESLVGDGTFLALNADVLTDADLTKLVDFHRDRDASATVLLTRVEDPSAFGVVPTDPDGLVTGFVEKPAPGTAPTDLINAGVYVLEPEVLHHIPAAREWSAERQLFPQIVEAKEMYALHLESYWIDIGTPEKYIRANLDAIARGGAAVADGARVEGNVQDSAIGPGSAVAQGASVVGSVLLSDVHVGGDARVTDSVLGEGVRVEDGATLSGAAIADGETVRRETAT